MRRWIVIAAFVSVPIPLSAIITLTLQTVTGGVTLTGSGTNVATAPSRPSSRSALE